MGGKHTNESPGLVCGMLIWGGSSGGGGHIDVVVVGKCCVDVVVGMEVVLFCR